MVTEFFAATLATVANDIATRCDRGGVRLQWWVRRDRYAVKAAMARDWQLARSAWQAAATTAPVGERVTDTQVVPETVVASVIVADEENEFVAGASYGLSDRRKAARKAARRKLDRGNRRAEMPSEYRKIEAKDLEELILG
jgi:butyrate kinase